jgi:hypothetical protein
VLAMAWFFLELIVKSMGLEQSRLFYHNLPLGSTNHRMLVTAVISIAVSVHKYSPRPLFLVASMDVSRY